MWTWANTPYRVNKCVTVSRMLSGRFRAGSLLRHFYPHISGICELCCEEVEDLPHILLPKCPRLTDQANKLLDFAKDSLKVSVQAHIIFFTIMFGKDDYRKVQTLLDPTVIPEIVAAAQSEPQIFDILFGITTTWCYSLNRTRLKLLGK